MSKKLLAILSVVPVLLMILSLPPLFSASAQPRELMNGTRLPFYIYNNFRSPENHYSPSGWMGDYGDLRLDERYKFKPKDSQTVIRVQYTAKGTQGAGWAGIYWQHPPNNWGNREGGYNLNGAKNLVFLARGARGGELIGEFKVGGIEGIYRDSGAAAIGPLALTKKWQEYSISLEGQELSSIAGGFCFSLSRDNNPGGATVYLDNIRFE